MSDQKAKKNTSKALTKKETIRSLAPKFTENEIALIKENICPNATEPEYNLFMYDCAARGLNPLKNQIHFIKYGKKKAAHVVGIDGYRSIAEATGNYEGQTDIETGPMIEFKDDLMVKPIMVPEFVKIGVYRKGFQEPIYARAYFHEYCNIADEVKYGGQYGNKGTKTGKKYLVKMWAKMPILMTGKCAEALALRKAFPDQLGGLYTDDEMQGSKNYDYEYDEKSGEVIENKDKKAEDDPKKAPISKINQSKIQQILDEIEKIEGMTPENFVKFKEKTFAGCKLENINNVSAMELIPYLGNCLDLYKKKAAEMKKETESNAEEMINDLKEEAVEDGEIVSEQVNVPEGIPDDIFNAENAE